MKYSFITAALAAAAVATVINVEVDGTEVAEQGRNDRHHNVGRHRHHRNNGHWWTDLFSRNGRDHNRHRHHRNGRNGRDRYETSDMLDDLFGGTNYECILDARSKEQRREDTRRCCEEQQGALFDERGHCILRDVIRNPRDQWRDCAMEQKGAEWAECYRREAREIDDKLDRSNRGHEDEDDNDEERRRRRHRNGRNHRDNDNDDEEERRRRHGNNGHRDHRNDQSVLDNDDDNNNHGRHGNRGRRNRDEFECRVNLDDQMRRQQIARQCCEGEDLGRYNPEQQTCDIRGRDDSDDFEQCVREQGAQVECYRD